MPERADSSELELIGFVRNGYATHVQKAISSHKPGWFSGLSRFDHLYHLLAAAEMLAWVRLGEAIGYFKEGSAERLWARTDPRIAEFFRSGPAARELLEIATHFEWTAIHMIVRAELGSSFLNIPHDDEDRGHQWLWVRTQLLLAQEFGRVRVVKGFLVALIGYSDYTWRRTLDVLVRGVMDHSRTRTLHRLIEILRETTSNEDGNIGILGPNHFGLLAGFLRTVDHIAIVCDHASDDSFSPVAEAGATIRRARLNFADQQVSKRFLALSDIATVVYEEAKRRSQAEKDVDDDEFPSKERLVQLMSIWSGAPYMTADGVPEQASAEFGMKR